MLNGERRPHTVQDFWKWAFSDLVTNTIRGAVAEFIVAKALSCAAPVRNIWESFDLRTPNGTKVEVKSASYRQAWFQKEDSAIRFNIAPAQAWNPATNEMEGARKRHADVYVFCLLDNRQPHPRDPMELSRWTFYVLRTAVLNEKCRQQKSIGLSALLNLHPVKSAFDGLEAAVNDLFIKADRQDGPPRPQL